MTQHFCEPTKNTSFNSRCSMLIACQIFCLLYKNYNAHHECPDWCFTTDPWAKKCLTASNDKNWLQARFKTSSILVYNESLGRTTMDSVHEPTLCHSMNIVSPSIAGRCQALHGYVISGVPYHELVYFQYVPQLKCTVKVSIGHFRSDFSTPCTKP